MAPATVALALVCRLALNPFLHEASPFTYFYMAIIVSAWLGGLGPGLVATVLSLFVVDYFYLEPLYTILGGGLKENIQIASFSILGAVVSAIIARMRREQRRAEQVADEAQANATEARRAEEALRLSEERLRATFDNAALGIVEADAQDRFTAVNEQICQILGYRREELLGMSVHELTVPEYRHGSDEQSAQLHDGRIRRIDYEKRYLRKDGTPLWVHVTVGAVRDCEGRYLNSIGTIEDISSRKATEEHLKDTERRLTDIIEFLPDATFALDNAGRITAWNKAMENLTGAPAGEVLGKGNHEYTFRLYGKRIPCLADVVLSGDKTDWPFSNLIHVSDIVKAETYIPHLKPGGVWLSIKVAPMYDAKGNVVGVIDSCRDITDRKLVEEQLRLQAKALDAAANGIIITDPNGTIQWANPASVAITGYNACELIGHNPSILKSGKQDEAFYRAMWETIRRGENWHGELVNRRKDGTLYNEEMAIAPVMDEHGGISHFIAIKQDITERKQIEDALRTAEERYRALINASVQVLYRMSPDWSEMSQLRGGGFIADTEQPNRSWLQEYIHPDDQSLVTQAISKAVNSGSIFELEHRVWRTDGTVGWTLSRAVPMRNVAGEIVEWFGAATDVTEQKRAQEALSKAYERLREADRRKDEFMAVLAHELRNPLAPIRYAVQMLKMNGLAQDQIQNQHEVIDRQISHMGRLLDDLLDVSRITRGKIDLKREIVDLRTIANYALDSLRPMIEGRGQHLLYEAPSSPLLVDGDPTRLEQIIRNLLHNANKYTEAGGCIKLSLGLDTGHEHEWRAVVSVSDSGIGIPPEILPHVFEVFVQAEQALARTQGGLGIGLSMVMSLVQMHGGIVEAHSAGQGKGSEFVVRLPLTSEPLSVEPEMPCQAPLIEPRRVLVVDDNEDAAASLGELLSLWGHKIKTAHDGRHALAAARQWQPDIVLLDIGLPGMDGYEVARRLREDPATTSAFLVALTGYGQEEDRRRAQEAGFNQHLTKPVEIERLLDLLHKTSVV